MSSSPGHQFIFGENSRAKSGSIACPRQFRRPGAKGEGLGFRVQGLGFRVQGLGSRV